MRALCGMPSPSPTTLSVLSWSLRSQQVSCTSWTRSAGEKGGVWRGVCVRREGEGVAMSKEGCEWEVGG